MDSVCACPPPKKKVVSIHHESLKKRKDASWVVMMIQDQSISLAHAGRNLWLSSSELKKKTGEHPHPSNRWNLSVDPPKMRLYDFPPLYSGGSQSELINIININI